MELSTPKEEKAPKVPGALPDELTHDPTQGVGTDAWQLSVQHSMEVNARNRRN